MTCTNCYHNDGSKETELEFGEIGFCTVKDAFRKHPCEQWVSETSPEKGEEELFENACGIYVTGQIFERAEYQRELDEFLDELSRRDIYI